MSIETRVRWGLLSALLASTALVTPAFAQDNTAPATTQAQAQDQSATADQGGVEEITVTAQRRSERLQDVPIAVTAVTPQAIQTAGVNSSLDLPHLATGVTSSPTTANAFFIPYIRGVGSNSPATGNDSSIAIYIDGVYQSDKSANVLDLTNIDRIEILKGPQGTLFGRNATGGAINIVTLQPSETFTASGEASYQTFDRWMARGYISGPLAQGLSGALSYQHIGGGDYATNTGPIRREDFGGVESDVFDGKLRWQPNAQFEATLGINYVDRQTTDLNSNLFPVPGTTPVGVLVGGVADFDPYEYAGSPNFYETKALRGTLTMRYSMANMDLVSITGYVHTTDETDLDFDGTSADLLYFNEFQGTNDWSQELQLLSTGSGPLQWVLGAYYFDGTARIDPLNLNQGVPFNQRVTDDPTTFPAGGSITSIRARGPTTAEAVYGQGTYALSDHTNLTLGLRYTVEERIYHFSLAGIGQLAPGFFAPTLTPLGGDDGLMDRTFHKLTWRLALDHHFTDDLMGYVSWNRGFKSGTYNMNDFSDQAPVNPEQLDAYEAGLKSEWMEHTLQVNLAVFYYNYKDIQIDTITASGAGTGTTVLQNAASEHLYGLDADLIYQPVENFQLRASASLLHAEYENFTNAVGFTPDAFGNGTQTVFPDASGFRGLFAPEWSINIGADYTWHLNGGSSVVLSGDYYRTAEFKVGIGPEDRTDEYDSLGASLTWNAPGDAYYVRAYGQNMTDQDVIGTSLSALKASQQEAIPASYGVAVGFHF